MRNTRKAATAAERLAEVLEATLEQEGHTVTLSHPDWSSDWSVVEKYRNVRFGKALAFLFRFAFYTHHWPLAMLHDVTGWIGEPASNGLAGHERLALFSMVPEQYKR